MLFVIEIIMFRRHIYDEAVYHLMAFNPAKHKKIVEARLGGNVDKDLVNEAFIMEIDENEIETKH